MMSKELEYTRKPDGGLAEHIEVLEAFADGDADNTELLMLLIELRSLREQLAELKALEPLGYIDPRTLADDGCSGGTWMKRQPREIGPYTMPLFTAAKPAED
ncbi:hypothetical protein ACR6U3_000938 [Yersinia enterocolitica]